MIEENGRVLCRHPDDLKLCHWEMPNEGCKNEDAEGRNDQHQGTSSDAEEWDDEILFRRQEPEAVIEERVARNKQANSRYFNENFVNEVHSTEV